MTHGDELGFLLATAQIAATLMLSGVIAAGALLRRGERLMGRGRRLDFLSTILAVSVPGTVLVASLGQAAGSWPGMYPSDYVPLIAVGAFAVFLSALPSNRSPRQDSK